MIKCQHKYLDRVPLTTHMLAYTICKEFLGLLCKLLYHSILHIIVLHEHVAFEGWSKDVQIMYWKAWDVYGMFKHFKHLPLHSVQLVVKTGGPHGGWTTLCRRMMRSVRLRGRTFLILLAAFKALDSNSFLSHHYLIWHLEAGILKVKQHIKHHFNGRCCWCEFLRVG